jgi:predicted Zn-ribbon and HTH transcriptional regulator
VTASFDTKDNNKGTLRQQMFGLLIENAMTALDLSQAIRVPEKEVYQHLSHIQKSVAAKGRMFVVTPSTCLACGYTFADRRRLTKPGRCPRCRESRVEPPVFQVK